MASLRVDPDRIIDAALVLLAEGGLEAVSIRRIATGLGVGASTLYWHVRDKDALLASLAQRIFRDCLDAVGEPGNWQAWLRAFGLSLWQAQIAIPDVRALIVRIRPSMRGANPATGEIVATLARLGLPEAIGAVAQRSVQALVTGWTTLTADGRLVTPEERRAFEQALDALIGGWDQAPGSAPGSGPGRRRKQSAS